AMSNYNNGKKDAIAGAFSQGDNSRSSPGVTLRRSVPQNGAEPMPQPDHISALSVPDAAKLDDDIQAVYQKCREKLGLVPNVLRAMSFHPQKLRNFMNMYNELMLGDSKLSKLERA